MQSTRSKCVNDTSDVITPWNTSRWLVCSSFLFVIPSIHAFYLRMYFFSILLLITSGISANHWRNALFNSWRRTIDLYVAKISFVVFLIDGIMYIQYTPYLYIAYINLAAITYCYYHSNTLYLAKSPSWYKYHIMFHMCVAYEQMVVIDNHRIRSIHMIDYEKLI